MLGRKTKDFSESLYAGFDVSSWRIEKRKQVWKNKSTEKAMFVAARSNLLTSRTFKSTFSPFL